MTLKYETKVKIKNSRVYLIQDRSHKLLISKRWLAYWDQRRTIGESKLVCELGVCYFKDGELHRNKKPAVILNDGTKIWAKKGKYIKADFPDRPDRNDKPFYAILATKRISEYRCYSSIKLYK